MTERQLRVVQAGDPLPDHAAVMAPDGAIVVDGTVVGHITHPGARQVINERNGMTQDTFPPGGRRRSPGIVTVGDSIPVAKREVAPSGQGPAPAGMTTPRHWPSVATIFASATATSGGLVIIAVGVRVARWVLGA